MKKLLHLQTLALMSGVQTFSLHLIDGLEADQYIVAVASAPGGTMVEALKDRGIRHYPVKHLKRELGFADIVAFIELMLLLYKQRFDIVHTNTSKAGLLGRLAAKICRVPYIIHTSHGMPFQKGQNPFVFKLFMYLERLANRWSHTVVYVNNSDRIRSIDLGLIEPLKATTIYNAIPPQLASALAEVAESRKMVEGKLRIGSTLRFCTQKNTTDLIRAAIKACGQNPEISFVIAGEGEDLELCRQMVKTHRLQDRIILPGFCSDLPSLLKELDVFVLYSRWEAMPFSIIEAMHAGMPVIGSDIEAIKELVTDEWGWIVALDDVTALADCFAALPGQRSTIQDKGKRAREYILAQTSYTTMLNEYQKLYEKGSELC